mgnify:CR=1 FL=1
MTNLNNIISKTAERLEEIRKASGISIEEVSTAIQVSKVDIGELISGKSAWDIVKLADYTDLLGTNINEVLRNLNFLKKHNSAISSSNITSPVPAPDKSKEMSSGIELALTKDGNNYFVPILNCELKDYLNVDQEISKIYQQLNQKNKKLKNREAIFQALCYAIDNLPNVNPSDIYHHIVYRTYLREYKTNSPSQSWVRAGGDAVELFIKDRYTEHLKNHGIFIEIAFQQGKKNTFLEDMNLADKVPGKSKLDIGLYGLHNNKKIPFGGIHSKASLAERVSDDKPCSEIMMKEGFYSYLVTFDAKSFPPPAGDLINKGELGSPDTPSDKRDYIEKYGSFSACFSYNTNTNPSNNITKSGKKIYSLNSFKANDDFVKSVTRDWLAFQKANL